MEPVRGTLAESEYVAMHRLHVTPPPLRLAVGLILLAIAVVATIVSRQWWFGLFFAYLTGVIFILTPWRARRDYRRNPGLSAPVSIRFTAEGLLRLNEAPEQAMTQSQGKLLIREPALIPWSNFKKWKANRQMLVLYVSWRDMVPIPASWFASPQAFNEFHTLIKSKVRRAG